MSDLISRSALIEEMKKAEIEYENAMMCPSWWSAFNIIREQPTAYSVDKVVEELEKLSNDIPLQYENNYEKGISDGIDKAIEIVKQGGVTDDTDNVCTWYKINSNACKCYTHAEIYDSRVLDWCVCPYCRKKIKIVGD